MGAAAFFYGTLMAPPVLHRVIHGTTSPSPSQTTALTIRPALLPLHTRRRVRGADYPAITATPADAASSVRGTFVAGLTPADLWRLDVFEGDEYARRRVRVRLLPLGAAADGEVERAEKAQEGEAEGGEGEEVYADAYIWIAPASRLEADEWDFEEFRREKMGRWVGGGADGEGEYAEVDDAVRDAQGATSDPTGGRGANGWITSQLEQDRGRERLEGAAV